VTESRVIPPQAAVEAEPTGSDHPVIATGGRGYQGRIPMWATLTRVHAARRITLLGIGGCYKKDRDHVPHLRGADLFAFEWALNNAVPCLVLSADWDLHGRPAGPIRNSALSDRIRPQTCVWAPGGTGTADMKRKCAKFGAEMVEVER